MEFDESFLPEEPSSGGVQARQVVALLKSLEKRTAYLMTEMRQAVELILNSEPELILAHDDVEQRQQKAISELTIDQLERYAPQWASLIPANPTLQSALSHQLSQKYGLIDDRYGNIRQALGMDSDAVKQAYESEYGQSLTSMFKIASESASASAETAKEETGSKKASQEQQHRYDIQSELEWVHLSGDDILFEQEEVGDSLYVMMHGRLRVIVELGDVREVVREVVAGEMVGEMALITGERRSATLQAVRDARLLKLSKASFERLIVHHPQIMIQIARIQSKRVRLLSVRPAYSTTLATLAVIPASPDVALVEFCQRFVKALAPYGSSLHLTSEGLKDEMKIGPLSHDKNDGMIVAWLSEQETKYRFIIYESDVELTSWTRRCLRQADHILIVGQANAKPKLGEIEEEMRYMSNVRKSLVLLYPNGNQRPSGTSKWLRNREVEQHYHLRWNMNEDFERVARLITGNGVGLALSSGGARGLAHIGVIRALQEEGIPIDVVGGTSQGAWISGMYAMGWDYETMMSRVQEEVKKDSSVAFTLPLISVLKGNKISKILKNLFGEQQIEDLWLNYFCISANLTYGNMMVHQSGLLWKYLRASSAVPGILPPVVDDNQLLADGATLNNLPTDIIRKFIQNGSVFGSNVLPQVEKSEQRLVPKEQYGDSLSGWRVLWRRLNPFTKPIDVPSIAEIMQRSGALTNQKTIEARKKVTDFQVNIDTSRYSVFDYDACDALVEIGYQTTQKKIAQWKQNGQWARKGLERFSEQKLSQ